MNAGSATVPSSGSGTKPPTMTGGRRRQRRQSRRNRRQTRRQSHRRQRK